LRLIASFRPDVGAGQTESRLALVCLRIDVAGLDRSSPQNPKRTGNEGGSSVQLVIAIPATAASQARDASQPLLRPVCGMPLLTRVLATAVRAGVDDVILIWPQTAPSWIRKKALSSPLLRNVRVVTLTRNHDFDPSRGESWRAIERHVETEFLWMPWNWITVKQDVLGLHAQSLKAANWEMPVLIDLQM